MKEKSSVGPFMSLPSAEICELIGLAGFDHVIFDTEHGQITHQDLPHLLRAAENRNLKGFVRTASSGRSDILRPLDMGARGLIVPQVDGAEEVRSIVYHAKYGPEGGRGVAMPRASDFGRQKGLDYFKKSNEEIKIFVQVESARALERLEEIASVEGIEGIFLGPYDLSFSLGIPGEIHHKRIEKAREKVLEHCRKQNRSAGIFVGSVEEAKRRKDQGFDFIALGMDTLILSSALRSMKEELADG